MSVIHKHLIVRAEVEKPFVSCPEVVTWLRDLAQEIGMNITESGGPHVDYVEKEGNCGIAGIVMIETSHIAIHCWDKQDPPLVQLDVYSCADFNHLKVLMYLSEMHPKEVQHIIIDRQNGLLLEQN
tara:strand:+ start:4909 stop:5286 length:378 start_codon:yes stop_codon:yes gene_type:complete